ncbi:MAG: septum formation inhibitor Maf [Nitrospirales bacterium]|nr:septum formation inhibitor Maf [Nitrospirales bacterium]
MQNIGQSRQVILASASPRRSELMRMTVIPFVVATSDYGEEEIPGLAPADLAVRHALEKASDVARQWQEGVVIGADTIVVLDNVVYGKPTTPDDACRMLRSLSGRAHEVITGLAVLGIPEGAVVTEPVRTAVFFRELAEEEIEWYIRTGEPFDKAGAYGIQGLGSLLIDRIEGDYFNVVGLPLSRTVRILRDFGITLP